MLSHPVMEEIEPDYAHPQVVGGVKICLVWCEGRVQSSDTP